MGLRRVVPLGLALSALALAAPPRSEMRSYVSVDGRVRPAFAWCDAPDRVLAVTDPGSPRPASITQPTTLVRWLKRSRPGSDAAVLTAPYRLGPSEGAAGSVYTRLSFPDGSGPDSRFFIRTSNVENVRDPAYRLTRVGEFRTPEGSFRCRSQPQAVFMGATSKRTVIVWDNGKAATYATRNFDGTPGVYVAGGQKTESVEGGRLYDFTAADGSRYHVSVEEYGPGTGGSVAVFNGNSLQAREPFLAYSVSLPSRERP